MKYVIIGNSAAGIGAVEGIRQIDKDGEITIISYEKYHTYSRPLISYLLEGKTDNERMKYRNDSFYVDNNCRTVLGKSVIKIDPYEKNVFLDDTSVIPFDKLLIATGSSPFVPPFEGLDTVENKFTFMTLDDALSLDEAISPKSRVLIVGAGLIGLKCAEGIHHKVDKITVVDLSHKVLSSILDDEGSEIIRNHLTSKGMEFKLGQSVKSFKYNTALLDNGEELEFDVLVLAVGVRPNTSLLKEVGADVNRGIITDSYQKTSIDDIYAAGDCTESYDITCNQSRILALLPNAYRQGECAGINMAGGTKEYSNAIPMNAIGFFGIHIITAGSFAGDEYTRKTDTSYKKLFYSDNLLKGYIMIGDVDKAGIYTSLIREKTPLDSIDFELICEQPSLMAFSKKYRDEKLGGIKQ